jgi:ribosomal protein S18 acetylase RimI-like enzyme
MRNATLADVPRICELNGLVFNEPERPTTVKNRILAFPQGCVVEQRGGIIGYSTAERRKRITNFGFDYDARRRHSPDGHILYISDIVIHPEHQGKGLGTAFLEFHEALARAEGCDLLALFTRTGKGYYERFGFTTHHLHDRSSPSLGVYTMHIMTKQV